ncbi:hypothetical protein PCANC_18398 [Puccinia coronata f. sp. avenae]|uniref:Uncharacterized protein n=1 Tax=Puccinia coronata f. sp. avenae TaxID=200324 RepID=A0A2N5TTK7_9BASI|nr:hypothetical protein PCANC_18398 [Puccinia coronata f. sp. avenae]
MEFLNDSAFEENSGSQESWLSPLPGTAKYIPFLDSQTQGLQMFTRRATSGAFPLIIPSSKGANTASKAGLDGRIRWPGFLATEFESVENLLGGTAPKFKSDGRIRY